jgi:hypothetical protein
MWSLWHCRALPNVLIVFLYTVRASIAQVVVTEVMHSPGGSDALWEWVEILNTNSQPVNLHGWVFDDDDDAGFATANISSAGGTRNTIVPAGGVAVLYPGDELQFMPERFNAAWGGGVTLIGVDGFTVLSATDTIGLWASYGLYVADAIPGATSSPRRNFAHAAATINYATGFPESAVGHSIAWNGSGSTANGGNWIESQSGVLNATTSVQTTIEDAQINSTDDRGNPGLRPAGPAAAGLLITEIMFAPKSPLATVGFSESDFEWIEIYNNTGAAIDFAQDPHVFDDDDGDNIDAANLSSGALAAGGIGILFNNAKVAIEDMQTMWGAGFNYIPVSAWPSLNNGGGDTIAIWESYSNYNSEPVVDSGRTHENAIAAVTYNTVANEGWPTINNQSSIWLSNLIGNPNSGTNWKRAGASGDTLSHQAAPMFDLAIDHLGGDVGSPGLAPGAAVITADGDYNDNESVDAADYVAWRKFFDTTFPLPNDPDAGTTIDHDQYNTWMVNFGGPTAGGSELGVPGVPEPTSLVLLAMCLALHGVRRRAK